MRSHFAIEVADMKPKIQLILFLLCYISESFAQTDGFQVSNNDVAIKESSNSELDQIEATRRDKRELESLDNDDYSSATQDEEEEPGFWDRVIRVALKLFNKFIEWLNSS